ncbi:hypothetical protein ACIQF5_20705 [Streptomyces goshikiensis]|uniref:hypothetical protein n=1 Tax=Streptomyces goshikiensis TaxID=1942 RepID=UPI003810EE25
MLPRTPRCPAASRGRRGCWPPAPTFLEAGLSEYWTAVRLTGSVVAVCTAEAAAITAAEQGAA